MTPKAFSKLPKDKMFAELRRHGIVHGHGNTKAELVGYYSEWYAAQAPSLAEQLDETTERRETLRARILRLPVI